VLSAAASVELVIAYVAAMRLGLVVVPVNTGYTRREVDRLLHDARPAGAIVDDAERASWMSGVDVVCGPEVELPDAPEPALDLVTRDVLAALVYTSGTTGEPKGAMLTSGNLLASAEAVRVAWRWTPADRLVLALPLFHLHGLGVGVNGTLTAGSSMVLLERFDVDAVIDTIAAERATLFFGVPTMYARLAESPRAAALAALRLCVSGSAPLSAELHRRLAERTGQQVLERYGMTETVMNVSNPYDGERRRGSVGLPLPGVEIRVAADGEILVRGPNVFRGYWEQPEATEAAFTADGWFRTGDLGARDSDGYLRIRGRSKDLIISGGYNVYPKEIESFIDELPGVVESAVIGVPHADFGEAVVAVVVRKPGAEIDEAGMIGTLRGRIANFKVPKRVHVVDELPRNTMGKVQKNVLREQFAAL
jgi:malonyl-CoA/methylmalonyl-CoA synthetase